MNQSKNFKILKIKIQSNVISNLIENLMENRTTAQQQCMQNWRHNCIGTYAIRLQNLVTYSWLDDTITRKQQVSDKRRVLVPFKTFYCKLKRKCGEIYTLDLNNSTLRILIKNFKYFLLKIKSYFFIWKKEKNWNWNKIIFI